MVVVRPGPDTTNRRATSAVSEALGKEGKHLQLSLGQPSWTFRCAQRPRATGMSLSTNGPQMARSTMLGHGTRTERAWNMASE